MQERWEYTETQLWRVGEEREIGLYHVFGLTVSRAGTVLAFCEARDERGADDGCHAIYMKRSTDNGRSFGENILLQSLSDGLCYGNPTPVADMETGRVILFYSINTGNRQTRLFVCASDDEGISWSKPADITAVFDVFDPKLAFHLPGPGHGIQLRTGPHQGRLLVPCWHRAKGVEIPAAERGYCASVLYSDDHGETWHSGQPFGHNAYLNEARIAEQADGENTAVILQARNVMDPRRWQAFSADGGVTFGSCEPVPLPPANVCDAGILSLPDGPMAGALLVSRVTSMEKRRNMRVCVSTDGGKTYEYQMPLPEGDAMPGYSDLTLLADGTVGLLHARYDHILFSRISLETLTDGRLTGTKRKIWL